jgi:hypothetical protein
MANIERSASQLPCTSSPPHRYDVLAIGFAGGSTNADAVRELVCARLVHHFDILMGFFFHSTHTFLFGTLNFSATQHYICQ